MKHAISTLYNSTMIHRRFSKAKSNRPSSWSWNPKHNKGGKVTVISAAKLNLVKGTT